MEQVSGRAGRKDGRGIVMIQVANTTHPVLQFVQLHDYAAFYKHELEGRRHFFYPPFSRVIQLTFKHKLKEVTDEASMRFAQALKPDFAKYISGPAEPVVNRIRNQYLSEITLKLPKDQGLLNKCRHLVHEQIAQFHHDKRFKSVVVIIDVDPM